MARNIYAIEYVRYTDDLIRYYAYKSVFLDTRYEISLEKYENLRKTFTIAPTTNNYRQGMYYEHD